MSQAIPMTVRSLVCHRDVDMAISCLGSLLRFSTEPLRLILHEDGSLTPEDVQKLRSGLEELKLVSRVEANELIDERLKLYPNSSRYRYESPLGLKLLDIPLLSQEDIFYCDTDILFFQPFRGLKDCFNSGTSAIFMMDTQEAYSIPLSYLVSGKIKLPSRVNSGLVFFKQKSYDLDFIEWFFKNADFNRNYHHWREQTCWAALGHRAGCSFWSPQQVAMIRSETDLNEQIVAGHFTTPFRHLLREVKPNQLLAFGDKAPVGIKALSSQDCNLFRLAQAHARVRLGAVKQDVIKKLRRP